MFKKYFGLLLVIALSYFAIQSFFISGFFPMHDDTQPARVYEMRKALVDGHFPVRWVSDLGYGYGYPIFNFYAPLSYYIAATFTFFTPDILLATKLMMILGIVLSAVFMYLLGKEIFGEYGAIIASLAYLYAPYHAVDIYVRGDVAEFWAYSFVPLLFYSVWKIYTTKKIRYGIVGALGFAGLILSHNLTALMVAPFLVVFLFVFSLLSYWKKNYRVIQLFLTMIILGLLLSAFYWLPTFLEMRYTNVLSQLGGGADFRDHFACLNQLWSSQWGFGGSVAGCMDGMSFKIGKVHVVLSSISIFLALLLLLRRIADASYVLNPKGIFFLFSTTGFLLTTFLTLEISKPVWEIIPLMAFFQYPWRFLILISFFSSLLCGFFVWFLIKSISVRYQARFFVSYIIIFLLVLGILLGNYKLFEPQSVYPKRSEDYTSLFALRWKISKISDEYLPPHFQKPMADNEIVNEKFTILNGKGTVMSVDSNTLYTSARIRMEEEGDVRINTAYFPSWRVYVDNTEKNYTITGKGLILQLSQGEHTLESRFRSTVAQMIGNLLSIIGIGVLIVGIIFSIKKKQL